MPNRSVREGCLDRHIAAGFIITVIVVFNFVLGSLWQITSIGNKVLGMKQLIAASFNVIAYRHSNCGSFELWVIYLVVWLTDR